LQDAQQALFRRYRSALAQRAQRVVALLNECRRELTPELRRSFLGELHTLKGEARMLGLGLLTTLVHGVEEQVLSDRADWEILSAAVDAISISLASETPEELGADMLQTACEALGLTLDAAATGAQAQEPTAEQMSDSSPSAVDKGKVHPQERWIQIEAGLVDQVCEALAGLTSSFARHVTKIHRWPQKPDAHTLRDTRYEAEELKTHLSDALLLCLGLRLTTIEPTLASLASHIRVLAKERGKLVDVVVRAQGVRIERDLLDLLREPLLHLCTNAVVHGIEPTEERPPKDARARIELVAETSGSSVIVRVVDDGRGIDSDALRGRAHERGLQHRPGDLGAYQMLFEPGFSTHHATDEVAGRGVGLDVVKRQVERAQGTIEVTSRVGVGTTFSLHLPAALTQEQLVVFRVGSGLFAISAQLVRGIFALDGTLPKTFRADGLALPLRSLGDALAQPEAADRTARVLVLQIFGEPHATWVPEVLGHFELLRRPTTPALRAKTGFAASAQLDDGRLVLILDARFLQVSLEADIAPTARGAVVEPRAAKRVLVVDDSVVVRDLISELLLGAGYETRGAENGVQGLQALEQFQPGLVISDIEMPRMDGFQFLEAIRARSQTMPVVLVTARSSTADRQRAAALGASAYVAKGEFESGSLIQLVGRYFPGAP